MKTWFKMLWDWIVLPQGRIGPVPYALLNIAIFVLKYAAESWDGLFRNTSVSFWDYFHSCVFDGFTLAIGTRHDLLSGIVTLLLLYPTINLAAKRLRSIGWPWLLVCLFLIPYINVVLFFLLCVLYPNRESASLETFLPDEKAPWMASQLASDVAAVSAGIFSVYIVTGMAIYLAGTYSYAVFVLAPFFNGFFSTVIYSSHHRRGFWSSLGIAILSLVFSLAFAIPLGLEGFGCIVMAFPILAIPCIIGVAIGNLVLSARPARNIASVVLSLLVLGPTLIAAEANTAPEFKTVHVRSSVEIDASPEQVWKNVVQFPELEEPKEWFFRYGIAYPIRAKMVGYGVGAIRYCEFNTGSFVEPIEVWDEPNILRFTVTKNPPPMVEFSPYKGIRPPHLDGYFESVQGEFRLERLPGNRTRLVGTTWYINRMEPQIYWNWWADMIVHEIHDRVLRHVKNVTESQVLSQK